MAFIFFRPKQDDKLRRTAGTATETTSADGSPLLKDLTELKTVLVIYPACIRSQVLKTYLENRSLSGGGPVERVERLGDFTQVVHFQHHADAVSIVRSEKHTLHGKRLYTALYDALSGAVYGGSQTAAWIAANTPQGFEILYECSQSIATSGFPEGAFQILQPNTLSTDFQSDIQNTQDQVRGDARNKEVQSNTPLRQRAPTFQAPNSDATSPKATNPDATSPKATSPDATSPKATAASSPEDPQASCFKELMEAHTKLVQFFNTEFKRMRLQLEASVQARMQFEVRQSQQSANMSQIQTLMKEGFAQIKAQHKTEVEGLKTEVQQLKSELGQLKPEVNKLRNKICNLRNEISQLQTQLNSSANSLEILLNSTIGDLEEHLRSDISQLQSEVVKLKAELRECQNSNADTRFMLGLQGRIHTATSEQTATELVALMGRNRSLREHIEELRDRLVNPSPRSVAIHPASLNPFVRAATGTVYSTGDCTHEGVNHEEMTSSLIVENPSRSSSIGCFAGHPPRAVGIYPANLNQHGGASCLRVENPSRPSSIEVFAHCVRHRGINREERISLLRFDSVNVADLLDNRVYYEV